MMLKPMCVALAAGMNGPFGGVSIAPADPLRRVASTITGLAASADGRVQARAGNAIHNATSSGAGRTTAAGGHGTFDKVALSRDGQALPHAGQQRWRRAATVAHGFF